MVKSEVLSVRGIDSGTLMGYVSDSGVSARRLGSSLWYGR